jgi:hypothetical protein
MDQRTKFSRIGSGFSMPMAILLLIFFFMPWAELNCGTMQIGEASGWQMTKGDMTSIQPDMSSSMPGVKVTKDEGDDAKDPSESINARPWFILGLIVPIALLGVGVLGLTSKMPTGGALVVLGAIGMVVMLLAANVDYSDEVLADMEKQEQAKKAAAEPASGDEADPFSAGMEKAMGDTMQSQMAGQIQTESTGIVWACLALYMLVVVCGAVSLVAPAMLRASRAGPAG